MISSYITEEAGAILSKILWHDRLYHLSSGNVPTNFANFELQRLKGTYDATFKIGGNGRL